MDACGAGGTEEFAFWRENYDATLGIGGYINITCFVDDDTAMTWAEQLPARFLFKETGRKGVFDFRALAGRRSNGDDEQEYAYLTHRLFIGSRLLTCANVRSSVHKHNREKQTISVAGRPANDHSSPS